MTIVKSRKRRVVVSSAAKIYTQQQMDDLRTRLSADALATMTQMKNQLKDEHDHALSVEKTVASMELREIVNKLKKEHAEEIKRSSAATIVNDMRDSIVTDLVEQFFPMVADMIKMQFVQDEREFGYIDDYINRFAGYVISNIDILVSDRLKEKARKRKLTKMGFVEFDDEGNMIEEYIGPVDGSTEPDLDRIPEFDKMVDRLPKFKKGTKKR